MVLRLVHFEFMASIDMASIETVGKMGAAHRRGGHVMGESVGYGLSRGVRIDIGESEEAWWRICVDGGIFVVPGQGWAEARVNENRA
jgi:hypothetical protein